MDAPSVAPCARNEGTMLPRNSYLPDPAEPVDRWLQFEYSDNVENVKRIFTDYGLGANGRWLYDPFCGAGSSLLAASRLGRAVLGNDLDPLAVAATGLKLSAHNGPVARDCLLAFWALARTRLGRRMPDVPDFLSAVDQDLAQRPAAWRETELSSRLSCSTATLAPTLLMYDLPAASVDLYTSPPYVLPGKPNPIAGLHADPALMEMARRFVHAGSDTARTVIDVLPDLARAGIQPVTAALVAVDSMPDGVLNKVCVAYENLHGERDNRSALLEELVARGFRILSADHWKPGPEEDPQVKDRGEIVAAAARRLRDDEHQGARECFN